MQTHASRQYDLYCNVFLLYCVQGMIKTKMVAGMINFHQCPFSYLFALNGKLFLFFQKQASTAKQQRYNNAVMKVLMVKVLIKL